MTDHPSLGGIPLVLGGNVFGWTASGDEGRAVLDAFYEAGGRMIDTADVYSAWIRGHVGGESESFIGEWLESRGVRRHMRIHTKTGMLPRGGGQHTFGADGDPTLYRPEEVLVSLDASLERLRTGYLDLYYAHRDYAQLPIEQIVEAFEGEAVVRSATSLEDARLVLAAERPSAVLLDAALPDGSGMDLIPELQKRTPRPTIIIFSAQEIDRIDGHGADAVLVKARASLAQLVSATLDPLRQPRRNAA